MFIIFAAFLVVAMIWISLQIAIQLFKISVAVGGLLFSIFALLASFADSAKRR